MTVPGTFEKLAQWAPTWPLPPRPKPRGGLPNRDPKTVPKWSLQHLVQAGDVWPSPPTLAPPLQSGGVVGLKVRLSAPTYRNPNTWAQEQLPLHHLGNIRPPKPTYSTPQNPGTSGISDPSPYIASSARPNMSQPTGTLGRKAGAQHPPPLGFTAELHPRPPEICAYTSK